MENNTLKSLVIATTAMTGPRKEEAPVMETSHAHEDLQCLMPIYYLNTVAGTLNVAEVFTQMSSHAALENSTCRIPVLFGHERPVVDTYTLDQSLPRRRKHLKFSRRSSSCLRPTILQYFAWNSRTDDQPPRFLNEQAFFSGLMIEDKERT